MGGNRTPHALLVGVWSGTEEAIIFTNHLAMPIPLSEFFRPEKVFQRSIKANMHGGEFATESYLKYGILFPY